MKKKSIITVISIIVIIISLIGIRYAYSIMIPEVKEENLSQSVIRAKELGLVFDDKTLVNCESLFPGITVTKEFDVTSKSDDELTYNVKFVNVTNDYGTDVVYKLYKNNELVVEETPLPKTKDLEYVYTSISIKPGEKHEYRMEITYLNLEDKLQKVDRTAEFHGTIEIDVEENIDELIMVNENTEVIANETSEFYVRNTSAVQNKTYNILLDDLTNEYEDGELIYSLINNGEEISNGDVPQEGELSYLTTNVDLQAGQTDTYNLTVTENVDDTIAYEKERYEFSLLSNEFAQTKVLSKKFSAKVVIDSKEVDQTPPNAIWTYQTKTTNSVTFKASCIDEESGIINYKFYKDGTLVETKEITKESIEYTFENLESKEYEFKLVCTNTFKVETKASDNVTLINLIDPIYEVASGVAQTKNVEIIYEGSGTYLFKATGKVTSNIDVIDCGKPSIDGTYSCSETTVPKGTMLTEGNWYKTESNPILKFTSNGSIIAKVTDGINSATGSLLDITGIDRESPSIPEVESEYTLGSWTNKDVILKVTSIDNEKVDYYEYKLSDGEWIKVSGNEIKFIEDMEGIVSIRAIDTAGNVSEIKEIEVKIDTKKPTITYETTKNTTYKNSQSTKVSASDNVEVTELKYAWSTSDKEPTFENTFTNGDTLTIDNVTGKYYLWVSVKDSAGNVTTTKTGLFYVDNTNPTCEISGNPTTWTTSATLSVSATDTEKINTNAYSWDGINYSTIQTIKVAANGTYTAYVKDEAGNIGSCSKEVIKIDTTAPETPTLSVSSKTTNSIVLKGGCSDAESGIITYAFYMDGILNKSYATTGTSQSHTINKVTNEEHTYKLVCTNGSNLTSNTSITASVKDLITPTYSVPSGFEQSKNVTISYNGDGAYLFKVTGTVTSNVIVTDCGENSTGGAYACTTTTVTAGTALTPGKWYKVSENPTLTFISNGSIVAKVADGTNYKSGSSLNVTGIDRTAPTVTFGTNGNTTWSKQQSTVVNVSDNASVTSLKYQWTQSTTPPTSNTFVNTFTNGETITKTTGTGNDWYLWIYARDEAENEIITKSNVFYLDNTMPSSCTILENPTSYVQSATLKVLGEDENSGLATNAYSWDGTTYSSTNTKSVTTNGTYTAYVKDNAGNVKSCSVEVTMIDRSGPEVIFSTNGNTTSAKSHSTKVTVSDIAGVNELKYYWSTSASTPSDASFTSAFTNESTLTTPSTTGNYYLWIYATDILGNVTKKKTTITFNVDVTEPSCTISGSPTSWTTSATLKVSGEDANSGLGTAAYSWDGTTYSSTNTKSVTTNGTYTAYVKDKAGNVGSCNIKITKVDNVTPSIKMVSGTYQRNNTTAIATVTYGASGGTTKCVNTSNSNASVTKVSNIGNLGVNTIKCTATSNAGKSSTKSSNITINATLTYGAGLKATETAYGSGTSVIIPTSGIQFGPYYNFNAGCYHIYYYGNNLNLSYKLNDGATGYLGFRSYTNNGSFYSLSTYNYSTTLAHFYLYIPSNSKSVEVVLSNGTNTTVTVDKVLINYHGTTCP